LNTAANIKFALFFGLSRRNAKPYLQRMHYFELTRTEARALAAMLFIASFAFAVTVL